MRWMQHVERVRRREMALLQPALHHRDLVALRQSDALAEDLQIGPCAVGGRPVGHHDRLCMMDDHALHEVDVGLDVIVGCCCTVCRSILRALRRQLHGSANGNCHQSHGSN